MSHKSHKSHTIGTRTPIETSFAYQSNPSLSNWNATAISTAIATPRNRPVQNSTKAHNHCWLGLNFVLGNAQSNAYSKSTTNFRLPDHISSFSPNWLSLWDNDARTRPTETLAWLLNSLYGSTSSHTSQEVQISFCRRLILIRCSSISTNSIHKTKTTAVLCECVCPSYEYTWASVRTEAAISHHWPLTNQSSGCVHSLDNNCLKKKI